MDAASASRTLPVERTNRTLLGVVGLVLAVTGLYVLLRSFGALGSGPSHAPVLVESVRDFVHRNDDAFWPIAAAVATLVGLLGLRWLLAQLRQERPGNADVVWHTDTGATTVTARAVSTAIAADVAAIDGVAGATARLVGDAEHPELHVYVDARDDAPVSTTRERIEDGAVANLRRAMALDDLSTHLRIRLVESGGRRLH